MFKSSVMAIIMATNIFGGSCSNENVKVEDVTPTNEVVMEEENIIEEYEHKIQHTHFYYCLPFVTMSTLLPDRKSTL